MQSNNQTLGRQLGDISTGLRSEDYNRQVGLAENDINRRMSAQQTDLARNSGLANNFLERGQSAWAQNQGNSLSAMGQIPGLNGAKYDDARALMNIGSQEQNLFQSALDQDYDDFTDWRDHDNKQLGVLANALGTVQGGSGSSTGANPNYKSAGQNAAGYAALLASMWG
ncbi:hypothetical protein ACFQZQ_02850 [Lysobacter koreensis]|uniref:Uncharacterized protein n=1 Tax=Lysobacter koreensis TaxID=266122 RepID=A0ABW2YIZ0_9GAMM